ncbi:hypothetical protein EW146_g2399 [Bondarzewia mesenterica]|uniref:VASt domain-containing protein n=1 Tax=Bondarzewia mesenterica TaxID=1095465 RepID=A0A4S4M110_9AGAM|nr:hypothetical protein EW146_g2399 [Bondarzewia mesenterica]
MEVILVCYASGWPSTSQNGGANSDEDSDTERGPYRSTASSDPSALGNEPNSELDGRGNGSVVTVPDPVPIIPYWSAKRHLTCGNPTPPPPWAPKMSPWRSSPGKLKTANAALVLCLNIDVDPPDIIKTNPCAVLECWVDPHTMPSHKALEVIGTNLQHQFEGLSPKIPYKPILDPSYEDLRRFCTTLRKQAKDDAVLFYYNGHGVPKPTPSGELWCFNRNYTQYIPVSLAEVQAWLGTPCVYIWDCSAAGNLLLNFNNFAKRRDSDNKDAGHTEGATYSESIQLAACAANEQLPLCPELPADLFTSCLTSPIDIALRYFVMHNQLPNNITADMVMQLPGDLKDRRTPLGELNWIFTAITDTIAWTTFSRELFTRLYRSDLLIASLFRNFLLAERIMKNYHCTPHTSPSLPPTNTHPLWASWDLAVDACLRQLPELLKHTDLSTNGVLSGSASMRARRQAQAAAAAVRQDKSNASGEKSYTYIPSRFFTDQLTAFEVWISRGGSALTKRGPLSLPVCTGDSNEEYGAVSGGLKLSRPVDGLEKPDHHLVPRKPPEQLPIVLQVLLSQPHRMRALILLSQFVDLGPWAVHLALAIGIFPYISKLLQAAGQDLRPVLIFIWARILAVDPTCQVDLYTNQGYKYFANVLAAQDDPLHVAIPNVSEHKAMCAFVLSAIARDYARGQNACWHEKVFHSCFERLEEGDFLLRQWSALCIAQMWDGNDDLKVFGVDHGTQDKFIALLSDDSPEVRTAALYALGTFLGASGSVDPEKIGGGGSGSMFSLSEHVHFRMEVAVVTGATLAVKEDASPMARKELLILISCLVREWRGYFVVCAWLYWEEDRRWKSGDVPQLHEEDATDQAIAEWLDGFGDNEALRQGNRVLLSSFFTIFTVLLELSVDPYLEVATLAQTIVDYIMALLLESPFTRLDSTSIGSLSSQDVKTTSSYRSRRSSLISSPSRTRPSSPTGFRPGMVRSDTMSSTISSGVSNTLRRTSSFANALKILAGGIAFPSLEDAHKSTHKSTHQHSHAPRSPPHSERPDISRPPSPNLNLAQYASPYPRLSAKGYSVSAPTSPTSSARSSKDIVSPRAIDFLPSDVMEALFEEDMERLRARRRAGKTSREGYNGALPSPSDSTSSGNFNTNNVHLGLGTGTGVRDVLPLKSQFFDLCSEYFKEPQMRQAEADETGSLEYNYQAWRQQRNEQVISETQSQAEVADSRQWDRPVTTLHVSGVPLSMAFHAYDPHLVVASETDIVHVWDWSHRQRLATFYNGNPAQAGITSVQFINQDVGGIILVSSADGMIRLYRNYDPATSSTGVQMVSAFRGLGEIIQVRRGSGVVVNWKQSGGSLLVSGDSRMIRVWDAHTESQLMDLATNSESPVTAMMSDGGPSSIFLASFADGIIKVFDRRYDEENAVVRSYNEHNAWVQNLRWHPSLGGQQFLSASLNGEVKLWDIRGSDRALETWGLFPNGLSAFDVHEQTGVYAASSALTQSSWRYQRTTVRSIARPDVSSTVNLSTGISASPSRAWPSPFIPRSGSLAFHPVEMLYGIGCPDGTVRVMGCNLAVALLIDRNRSKRLANCTLSTLLSSRLLQQTIALEPTLLSAPNALEPFLHPRDHRLLPRFRTLKSARLRPLPARAVVPFDRRNPVSPSSPPSPQSHAGSFPSTREGSVNDGNSTYEARERREGQTTQFVSIESPRSDDDLATPTPGHIHTWNQTGHRTLTPSSSTGNLRDRVMSAPSRPRSPAAPSAGRDATETSIPHTRAATDTGLNVTPIVDSPTSLPPEFLDAPTTTSPTALTPTQSFPGLLTPQASAVRDSDSVSVVSTASARKKRPWRRSSANTSPPAASQSPKRKHTGLASALAASGLAMVNPGMMPLIDPPAVAQAPSTSQRLNGRSGSISSVVPSARSPALSGIHMSPRSSLDTGPVSSRSRSHSRNGSLSVPQDLGDSDESSGPLAGEEEDEELDDDDDQLLADLRADDIPVTGFAVASNKRNADFHDLFPSVPEGDYLIEDYGCALQREILIQGRIYISENHICFHANIFGWITDLVIPIYEILSLDKRMTAFVIPNAIQITTRSTKYTFASFLARDTVYDVIYNIWRLALPDDESVVGLDDMPGGLPGDGEAASPALVMRKATQCACLKEGKHFSDLALETVLPGTPERIYNLLFASGFIKDFMRVDQKLEDIQISDWAPSTSDPKCLTRNMSYIKPLNSSIGPKSTKCELRDETIHCDFEDYIVTITTTRTPDVPSGGVFSVKTRTCIMWASAVSTKVIVTTQVEWTGRSFIKGIIEKSAVEGQKTYHADLDKAARDYIQEHQSEFIPAGVDVAAVVAAAQPDLILTPSLQHEPLSKEEERIAREHERNQRGLQWAYDTFEGAYNVGKHSAVDLIELLRDTWDQSSTSTILYIIIALLLFSNAYTLFRAKRGEDLDRRMEIRKLEDREKWVQGIVTALWDELSAGRQPPPFLSTHAPSVERKGGAKEEIADLHRMIDAVEERVRYVRQSLNDLD